MEQGHPETISLVVEHNERLIGHVAFSPATIDGNYEWIGYIMAPVGVIPDCQRAGIGKNLINHGIEILIQKKINTVFVYGDPRYYGKFGFIAQTEQNYLPPYQLGQPFGWQARELMKLSSVAKGSVISCVNSLKKPELW